MALETSADKPVPVRTVARLIGQWISRLGRIWVEGQITQISRRPGQPTVFLTLRDPDADVSLQVTCRQSLLDAVVPPIGEGQRVVIYARPEFFVPRGQLSLVAEQIRPVGLGELLARIEQLRRVLHAEGVFDPARKQRLPFLPATIGLICGRGSAAERDVLDNARRRWPAVRFRVEAVPVQGPYAVTEIRKALTTLDRDPDVEVIVIARGGGSVEDLLPFSDEALIRAVAACRTPVVSAIGHEQDSPLLDFVADVRASTPTDAAKRIVPDVGEEARRVSELRARLRRSLTGRLDREQASLDAVRQRPVLARPRQLVDRLGIEVTELLRTARRSLSHRLDRAIDELRHNLARVQALSPQATLGRGYAVVQLTDGAVVRDPAQAPAGTELVVRVAEGKLAAESRGSSVV
ncbi:MAG: exodeoxyribonuclease VII large subunit [Sporichthyaceae bacterium]|nr:exodeoxyribonuclease VII large subunit [Sporichthyaceae bacterium]